MLTLLSESTKHGTERYITVILIPEDKTTMFLTRIARNWINQRLLTLR